jgi:hypothetical protein
VIFHLPLAQKQRKWLAFGIANCVQLEIKPA